MARGKARQSNARCNLNFKSFLSQKSMLCKDLMYDGYDVLNILNILLEVHKKLGKKFSFLTSKVTLHIKSTFIIGSIWCKTGTSSIPRDHTTFIFQSSEKKKKRLGTHSKFLLRSMRSLKFFFFFAKMLWQSSKKMSSFYQHTWRLFFANRNVE